VTAENGWRQITFNSTSGLIGVESVDDVAY
jgi:hypothetical protein